MALSLHVGATHAEVHSCMYLCVCVCVCVKERKIETERDEDSREIVLMHTLCMPLFVYALTFHSPGISDMPAGSSTSCLPTTHPSIPPSLHPSPPGGRVRKARMESELSLKC